MMRTGALVTALVLLACGEASESDGWQGSMHELANGAVLVSNPHAGLWEGDRGWHLEETMRLGSLDGSGPDVFGVISALEVDADGNIYVFDRYAGELRIFTPEGEHARTFGRRGSGPGEFQDVIGVASAPDGALWLVDPQNVRYTILDGDEASEVRRPSPIYRLPWMGGSAADGSFFDSVVPPGDRAEVLVRIGVNGSATEVLRVPEPELPQPRIGNITLMLPFAPHSMRTFDPRGAVWTANTHEYRLTQIGLGGDTLRVVERDYPRARLDDAQLDTVRTAAAEIRSRFGIGVSGEMIPTHAPVLRWFQIAPDGYIWVARAGAPRELDLFDPEGRFLGVVELPFSPAASPLPSIRDDGLHAVAEDDYGAPVVVKTQIRR